MLEKNSPDDHVLFDLTDGVATITLDRPDRRNAMSSTMTQQLGVLLDEAESDPQVHAWYLPEPGVRSAEVGTYRSSTRLVARERVPTRSRRKRSPIRSATRR